MASVIQQLPLLVHLCSNYRRRSEVMRLEGAVKSRDYPFQTPNVGEVHMQKITRVMFSETNENRQARKLRPGYITANFARLKRLFSRWGDSIVD
jgi:hypothetical protein